MLSRYPVLSLLSGFNEAGVPTGFQLVGRPYWDETVFEFASAYEQLCPRFRDSESRPKLETRVNG